MLRTEDKRFSEHLLQHPVSGGHLLEHPIPGGHLLEHPVSGGHLLEHPVSGGHLLKHPVSGGHLLKHFSDTLVGRSEKAFRIRRFMSKLVRVSFLSSASKKGHAWERGLGTLCSRLSFPATGPPDPRRVSEGFQKGFRRGL